MRDGRYCVVVATTAALLAFVLFMWCLPEIARQQGWAICSKDECTVQGWISASSGWVGAIATGATLLFLYLQHRENNQEVVPRRYRLAARMIQICDDFDIWQNNCVLWNLGEKSFALRSPMILMDLDKLTNMLTSPIIDDFESSIGVTYSDVTRSAIKEIDKVKDSICSHAETYGEAGDELPDFSGTSRRRGENIIVGRDVSIRGYWDDAPDIFGHTGPTEIEQTIDDLILTCAKLNRYFREAKSTATAIHEKLGRRLKS